MLQTRSFVRSEGFFSGYYVQNMDVDKPDISFIYIGKINIHEIHIDFDLLWARLALTFDLLYVVLTFSVWKSEPLEEEVIDFLHLGSWEVNGKR